MWACPIGPDAFRIIDEQGKMTVRWASRGVILCAPARLPYRTFYLSDNDEARSQGRVGRIWRTV